MMYLGNQAIGIATLKELDGVFEVVHRFTPEDNIDRYTFPNYGPGYYVFLEDPILTSARFISGGYDSNSLVMGGGVVYNDTTGSRAHVSLTMLSSTTYDFWGSYFTTTAESITIGIAASNIGIKFLKGHNYMILKTKDI